MYVFPQLWDRCHFLRFSIPLVEFSRKSIRRAWLNLELAACVTEQHGTRAPCVPSPSVSLMSIRVPLVPNSTVTLMETRVGGVQNSTVLRTCLRIIKMVLLANHVANSLVPPIVSSVLLAINSSAAIILARVTHVESTSAHLMTTSVHHVVYIVPRTGLRSIKMVLPASLANNSTVPPT